MMKLIRQTILLIMFYFALSPLVFAQAVTESRSIVEFTDIGEYIEESKSWITPHKIRSDEKTEFKGKGFIKSTVTKLFLRSSETSTITLLPEKKLITVDHKDKSYKILDLFPISADSLKMAMEKMKEAEEELEEEPPVEEEAETPKESDIEIIKTEFTVTKTGKSKNINNFNCDKYNLNWVMQWRVKATGETGTDSLFVEIWTTPQTDDIRKAVDIEMQFRQNYLAAIGIDLNQINNTEEMLGIEWIEMLAKMQSEKVQKPDTNTPEWVQELAIIKGKPIYVEGSYYMIRPKTEETNESDENSGKDITNAKDAIGGFMKKKLFGKKRKESELKPILVYVNEVIKLGTDNFSEDIFYIPKDYKEKKEK
jgi:hypothetical protein